MIPLRFNLITLLRLLLSRRSKSNRRAHRLGRLLAASGKAEKL